MADHIGGTDGKCVILADKDVRQHRPVATDKRVFDNARRKGRIISRDGNGLRLAAEMLAPVVDKRLLAQKVRRRGAWTRQKQRFAETALVNVVGDFLHRMDIVDRNRDRVRVARGTREDDQLAETTGVQGGVENLVVELDADQDDGVDAAPAGVQERVAGIVTIERVDQKHVPAFAPQNAGQPLHHHQLVGIGEVVDQQRHQIRTVGGEACSPQIRHIAKLFRGDPHLFEAFGGNGCILAEGAVHRPARNAGFRRHIIGSDVSCKGRLLVVRHVHP
ncbi:hypothetical protein D3C73_943210 [compost metagenome]